MYNFFEKIIEYVFIPFLVILIIAMIGLVVFSGYVLLTEKTNACKLYSKEYTAHGFVMSGQVMVPTTYTTRDCLVWEKK